MSSVSDAGGRRLRGRGDSLLAVCAPLVMLAALASIGRRNTVGEPPLLRVCADPNNLPYSNRAGQGFENRIAALLATDMHATLEYTWRPEQRGFLRNTLNAGKCDVVLGIVAGAERVRTTAPYYRSEYVFVMRHDRDGGAAIQSFDDARLRRLTIGVPVIGQDYNALPPVVALARRHLVQHVVGFTLASAGSESGVWAKLINAVASGVVDVAVAWGPPAGYFSQRAAVPLDVTPVASSDMEGVPFAYAIAAGVRRNDATLATQLGDALARRSDSVRKVLHSYGVVTVPLSDSIPDASGRAGVVPGISPSVVYGNLVNPLTGNAPAVAEGRRLFVWYNCSGCHGGRAGGGMGPSLRDSTHRRYGNTDTQLLSTISEGRPEGMPAWGKKIPRDQVWKLIAYIRTLGTPQEPDQVRVPPPR